VQPRYAATLNKLFMSGQRTWPDPLDLLDLLRRYPALSAEGMDSKFFGNSIAARYWRRHAEPVDAPDVDFHEFHHNFWWIKRLTGRKVYQPFESVVVYMKGVVEKTSAGAVLAACLLNDLQFRARGEELEVKFVSLR
jgi:hypothetical protein